MRESGPFKGKGKLLELADEHLRKAWEEGTAQDVSDAMRDFRTRRDQVLMARSRVANTDLVAHRAWLKSFAKWLYSTDHISVQYSVDYDGTDIRNLSPGTRGIVLLLLYLVLDHSDDRPLIIDQPEENLDPKSIFDELVPLFADARRRRQVIMVTHNANLVINTDADQIIIAEAGTHTPGQLPSISYISGGLDEASIRERVCAILEGGDDAFKSRARRCGVPFRLWPTPTVDLCDDRFLNLLSWKRRFRIVQYCGPSDQPKRAYVLGTASRRLDFSAETPLPL